MPRRSGGPRTAPSLSTDPPARTMIGSQRHLFSISDSVHYINCAYMGPLLKTVEAAGIAGVRKKAHPWEVVGDDFFGPGDETRRLAGRLVNAPPDQIALTPAVSYGTAIAAAATPLRPGQNVVIPGEEFPSVVYGWRERCRLDGAAMRTVPRPEEAASLGAVWNERLLEAIDKNTAVVALTIVHWTDGTLFDVEAIVDRSREVGALFILDGTQSVGAYPFDFAAIRPDLLLCAGYKWLLGPYSLGITVVGERLLDARPFEHNWANREESENFAALVDYKDGFQPGARRFDVGERANFALIPMLNAALTQILEWGVDSIQQYCVALERELENCLGESPYRIAVPRERGAHLFGIRAPDSQLLPRIEEEIKKRNVFVSLRGTAIRFSPHLYNPEADMAALAEALLAALD